MDRLTVELIDEPREDELRVHGGVVASQWPLERPWLPDGSVPQTCVSALTSLSSLGRLCCLRIFGYHPPTRPESDRISDGVVE